MNSPVRSRALIASALLAFAMFTTAMTPVAATSVQVGSTQTAAKKKVSAVGFATYNVCKIECGTGQWSWPNRRSAITRTVGAANAQVLAVQEADLGDDHINDVARLLKPQGYRLANTGFRNCVGSCGAHIFYKQGSIAPVLESQRTLAGMVSQRSLTKGAPWGGVKQDRTISWALLRTKSTGNTFMVISMHLPNEKTGAGESVRNAVARAVARWSRRKAIAHGYRKLPTIVMGDLNSHAGRQPNGAQKQFTNAGFTDAYNAPRGRNRKYSSINFNQSSARWLGFPPRPFVYGPSGTRLDYILSRNTGRARSWELMLRLKSNGAFDNRFRGSDHNLIRATIPIR